MGDDADAVAVAPTMFMSSYLTFPCTNSVDEIGLRIPQIADNTFALLAATHIRVTQNATERHVMVGFDKHGCNWVNYRVEMLRWFEPGKEDWRAVRRREGIWSLSWLNLRGWDGRTLAWSL